MLVIAWSSQPSAEISSGSWVSLSSSAITCQFGEAVFLCHRKSITFDQSFASNKADVCRETPTIKISKSSTHISYLKVVVNAEITKKIWCKSHILTIFNNWMRIYSNIHIATITLMNTKLMASSKYDTPYR